MADVIVVGAGVIGCSVAYHLAARGVRDVLVIDRGPEPGTGSTPRATGGFRAQFGSAINVRLSLLSREKLLRFEEETGVDPGFAQHGYLFLARSSAVLTELAAAQAVQHACGLTEARMVSPAVARSINPAIGDDAVVGGAYCPSDGFIRAMQITRGYCEAAQRLGVRFDFGVEVETLALDAGAVVDARGAWAGTPIEPLLRCVAPTVPTSVLPANMPMTIWADDGYHLRMRDGRALLLLPDASCLEDAWLSRVAALTHARVPPLRGVPIDREACWSGFYEMSPDKHALLGRVAGNVYICSGSSGHGVMHAPALGQLLAEIIVDGRATTIDAHVLRPSRFAEGEPIVGSALL
ncbi:MAG TPA: FAD-dependent oxidoreductase [Thermoanaerobaculia bacterium]|nr:FAD-dependent oxidoreductase [Thermoanaerobaculia bacterium]